MEKRLQTVLAHAGVASRRAAGELIEEGKVTIDGLTVTEKGMKLDPQKHVILVSGKPLPRIEQKYYFLFNKPKGVISTASDTHERSTVLDYFSHVDARLYPVGRLDKDTMGLLVITNDGDLTHRLSHPSFEVVKEYIATIFPDISEKEVERLKKGIKLEEGITSTCEIRRIKVLSQGASYRIKLHEGRNRQIRRMFESANTKVMALTRVRYANMAAGRLKPGESRPLTEREVERLKSMVNKPGKKPSGGRNGSRQKKS